MLKNSSIFKKYLIFFILCGFLPIIVCSYIMFTIYEKNTLDNTMKDIDYLFKKPRSIAQDENKWL